MGSRYFSRGLGRAALMAPLVSFGACGQSGTTEARGDIVASAGDTGGDAAKDLTTFRAACLATTNDGDTKTGDKPLRETLKRAQADVQQKADTTPGWVAVGNAWLALADMRKDPEATFNAEGCLEVALALDPKDIAALELEGTMLLRQHRFAAALERAESVLAIDPQRLFALGLACDALIELGRYEEAAKRADTVSGLKPGPAVFARSAFFAFLSGNREKAKADMRSALMIGRNPQQPNATAWAFAEAARMFWNEGDYSGAEAVFKEALVWAPSYPPALLGVGRSLLSQQRAADAVPWLERARDGGQTEAAWLLGDAWTLAGDADKAKAAYAQFEALAVHERMLMAQYLGATKGDATKALTLIEAEAKGRGGVWLDDTLAWSLYRAGRVADALVAAKRATALGTKDPRILYHAGAIMLAAGDAQGRALVAEAIALNPHFDVHEAADAQKLLVP